MNNDCVSRAESIIGYVFSDKSLLLCALTYKSYVNEYGGESNERLEYLGDSVLNLIAAELLYRATPADEGVLTELRKGIVSRKPLAAAVKKMGLLECCRMGKGAKMGLADFGEKPISDLFEAALGAIYLDGGFKPAREFVARHLLSESEK